jgi:putative hydrolase of the HAD superfamily
LGGVVFNWQPEALTRGVFADPESQALAMSGIIGHHDWVELDRGSIPQDQAISRATLRTGLSRQDVEDLFAAVPPSLTPIEESIALIRDVRAASNRLYVLSNMQFASIAYLENEHDIWDLFDGAVISCRVNKVKPEQAIYEHLLNEYRLSAAETVFIDDMIENVEAAASLGIQTIRFVDPLQCRRALVDFGCI